VKRYHHLDALRAAAMLVVVVWHLTNAWMLGVPLSDTTSTALEWVLAVSRWSLPLFFLMAGFFGAALLKRWGPKDFAVDRLTRIGLPLAVGMWTIVPLSTLAFREAGAVPVHANGPAQLLHLWFLWYVLLFYAAALVATRLSALDHVRRWVERLLASSVAVPVLALLTLGLMFIGRRLAWPATDWYIPEPGLLCFYGAFFAIGFLVYGRAGIGALGRRPLLNVGIVILALIPTVTLRDGPLFLGPGLFADTPRGWLWMGCFCLGSWAGCLAVCGIAQRLLMRDHVSVRYVADSSYWIYLAHMPLTPLLVLLLAPIGLPFPVAWTVSLVLLLVPLLVLYELAVRHTPVGWVLNGRRPPRSWRLWPRPGRVPKRATG
jgi:glucans biosynthesis protein C